MTAGLETLYPFAPHFIDLPGARYHYVDEGEGDPVVMVHGNPTWSFYYRELIRALAPTHRVIAPDHVGCGRSDKPQRYDYTLAQHVQNLEALIERLDLKRVTLVLHDWGGPIGMGYATRHPENVARIVLMNTIAFWIPEIPLRLRFARLPVVGDVLIRGMNLFLRFALQIACKHRERLTPDVRAGYLAPYRSYADRVAHLRFVEDIPVHERHPTYAVLRRIETGLSALAGRPMLLIWGDRDPIFTPRVLIGWQRRFPSALVRRLPDAGHWVLEDAPDRVVPWVREFLAAHPVS